MKFLLPIMLFLTSFLFGYHNRIYVTIPFFNELELLKCQFEELYDHVDYFVISEARYTFQGNPKPLYFDENKHLFSKYGDKIRHVIVESFSEKCNTWSREATQRNACHRALSDAKNDDVIFIVDADEIVRSSKLQEMVEKLYELKRNVQIGKKNSNEVPVLYLEMYGSGQFMNATYGNWTRGYMSFYKLVKSGGYDHYRTNFSTYMTRENIFKDSGWHFSSLGGLKAWKEKFESFSHEEANTPYKKSLDFYLENLRGKKFVPIDSFFPKYVRDHYDHFVQIGYIYVGQFDEYL